MNKFKAFTLLLGVLLLASATSCKKDDGVYSPSKKIQKVYHSSTIMDKTLYQVWNWDGKLLASIDYYSYNSDTVVWTERFTYDGNRLSRVDNIQECTVYEYDGKHLKSAHHYYHDDLDITTVFEYKDGKLDKATVTYLHGYKKSEASHLGSSVLPFPSEYTAIIEKCNAKLAIGNEQKSEYVLTYQFSWDGDNVVKIIATYDGGTTSVALQYDNKNNPLKGFMDLWSWELDELEEGDNYVSKNNVTNMTFTYSDGDTEVSSFIYQYDSNNYPTMRTTQYPDAQYQYQYTTYYEY